MDLLRVALLTDGSSDRRLLPVARWVLQQHTTIPLLASWADLSVVRPKPATFAARIQSAVDYYPSDVLLVHRDSERADFASRVNEIENASVDCDSPTIPLVPVRMQEAWLLFDEAAIRAAAANPRGTAPLGLPAVARLEDVADPKDLLVKALQVASEKRGRYLRRFDEKKAAYRLAELIPDYSPLRALPAFRSFETAVQQVIADLSL